MVTAAPAPAADVAARAEDLRAHIARRVRHAQHIAVGKHLTLAARAAAEQVADDVVQASIAQAAPTARTMPPLTAARLLAAYDQHRGKNALHGRDLDELLLAIRDAALDYPDTAAVQNVDDSVQGRLKQIGGA